MHEVFEMSMLGYFKYDEVGVFTVRFGSVRFRLKKPTEPYYSNFVKY